MTASTINDVSFEDTNGVGIKIPSARLNVYSTTKARQLHVVSRILADQAAGFNVELNDGDVMALAGIAEDLAKVCKEVMYALASVAFASEMEIPAPRVLRNKAKNGDAQ